MKKLLLITCLFCLILSTHGQDLAAKIPSTAKVVVNLKGKNITDLVSTTEFENSKVGQLFLKELKKETDEKMSNLNDLGLDLKRNFYYFMESDSLGFTNSFLVPLNNKNILSLMSERQQKKIQTDGEFSYFVNTYDNMVTMWNDNTLLITFKAFTNHDNYNVSYYPEPIVEESIELAYYPVMKFEKKEHNFGNIIEGDVVKHTFKFTNTGNSDLLITNVKSSCGCTVPEYPKNSIAVGETGEIEVAFNSSGKSGKQLKTITITANTETGIERLKIRTNIYVKGTKQEDMVEEAAMEEVVIESTEDYEIEETVIESTGDYSSNNDYYEKRRKEREAKELERNNLVLTHAKEIMRGSYSNRSILKNTAYTKALGKGQDEAIAWVGDFGSIYSDLIGQSMGYGYGMPNSYLGMFNNLDEMYRNMSVTAKLNFDETSATLKTDYTMSDAMAKYTSAMYNGKMNSKFFRYFNEDNMLAYFSLNSSVKGMLEAYPDMMSDMFENSGENEIAVAVPLMMDVLSLLIDEEGAAKILRGDMLFVLTELKEREVTYTTYEYDDDFNRKEVTKTKTETLPDFLIMATSSEKELFRKIMKIAIKESRGAVTLNSNGIYQIESKEIPIALNFLFKDDTVIMGSSIEHLTAISRGTFKGNVGGKHKKMIAKNSAVIYVNGKSMVTKFPQDMMPREIQSKMDFIAENTEDVVFRTSKVKGNSMQGEMILNTPEKGHKNSLAYFLNMIDTLMD